ncbi:uncharacterized protein LOC131844942 [Achroia grisella]|uniref:uncharacterized protein LOC131844942 n=1 Tax=Achroia grisella TaxID=688607 RepID=UPI0027D2B9FE|nr:uncharacterized protein LOC131844942 [Achroia grisella]
MTEVKRQNIEIKNQVSSILAELSDNKTTEIENKLQNAELEIHSLKLTVSNLEQHLALRKQDNVKNEVEIVGTEETENKNIHHLVLTTAQKIGLKLEDIDIDDVIRVGTKKAKNATDVSKFSRPIVVKLLRKSKRDELIRAGKSRKNLTSENITNGNPTKIYFNERLTKHNRQLFREARLRTRENGFRYC